MHFLLICMILISKWISLEVQFLKYKLHALISMGNLKFNSVKLDFYKVFRNSLWYVCDAQTLDLKQANV